MKQRHINIASGIVLAFDFFTIGFNIACGKWFNAVGLLLMSACLFLIVYQGNMNEKVLEETKKVDAVLPYAAALAIIARHLKDEREHEKKGKVPSCSAENNDQISYGNNSNVGDKK